MVRCFPYFVKGGKTTLNYYAHHEYPLHVLNFLPVEHADIQHPQFKIQSISIYSQPRNQQSLCIHIALASLYRRLKDSVATAANNSASEMRLPYGQDQFVLLHNWNHKEMDTQTTAGVGNAFGYQTNNQNNRKRERDVVLQATKSKNHTHTHTLVHMVGISGSNTTKNCK